MQITVRNSGDVKVLDFEGKLDTQTSADAQARLTQLIDGGERKLLLNFETLDYISSAGLRILLVSAKQLTAAGGELRICCLNEVVREVFEISGFTTIFNVFGTEAEALNGF